MFDAFKQLSLVAFLFVGSNAYSYVECETYVTMIQPHKTNGIVYFKFEDGTAIQANENDSGLNRNMSVALAAIMAKKKVRIYLNDGELCGSNRHDKWSYIAAINN
jgi:hypothetical protein